MKEDISVVILLYNVVLILCICKRWKIKTGANSVNTILSQRNVNIRFLMMQSGNNATTMAAFSDAESWLVLPILVRAGGPLEPTFNDLK